MSTQCNKTGVGQSKSKQEALGQNTQDSCAWCRNPEDPQAQGKTEIRTAAAQRGGLEGLSGAGLSLLSWRGLRHWIKIKADTCPSTFLLSLLRLCMSPEIMQHQGAQKWEQHKGLLWHVDPSFYAPLPPGNIQNPAVLGVTAGLCPGQGPLSRQSKGILLPGGGITRRSWGWHPGPLSSCITQSLLTASSTLDLGKHTLRRNPWGRSALQAAERRVGPWLLTPGRACPARPPRLPRRRPRARWPWCAAGDRRPRSAPAPGPA